MPELRGRDLAAEERDLVTDRVRPRIRVREREIVRSSHILVGDPGRNRPGAAHGVGQKRRQGGVDVRDPGTAAVERRVGHGQDEVVLRIDRDGAGVDVGDGRSGRATGGTAAGVLPES